MPSDAIGDAAQHEQVFEWLLPFYQGAMFGHGFLSDRHM